jgi:peroxiredoxin
VTNFRKLLIPLAAGFLGLFVAVRFLLLLEPAQAREVQAACRGLRPSPTNPIYGAIPDGSNSRARFPQPLEFTVQDYKGNTVLLSQYRGRVVLVNFWASWCNVCKSEKPGLEALQRKFSTDDMVVLALASDTDWEKVRAALPQGSPLTVLLDPPEGDGNLGKWARAYGITAVPETFVIDRQGNLRYYLINRRDWDSGVADTCVSALVKEGA